MRRVLDGFYLASGVLAGIFLIAIGVTILAQIVGRFVNVTVDGTELSGYCLAASSFLGLAYTFRHGTHIRVNLLIRLATGRLKQVIEVAIVSFCAVMVAYFAYRTVLMVIESFQFGDISPGLLKAPLWIPQMGMAAGLIVLTVALLDELVSLLRGNAPTYEEAEAGALAALDDASPH